MKITTVCGQVILNHIDQNTQQDLYFTGMNPHGNKRAIQ